MCEQQEPVDEGDETVNSNNLDAIQEFKHVGLIIYWLQQRVDVVQWDIEIVRLYRRMRAWIK